MLAVGDKVVYPMHGAGVIEAVEEHEVMGNGGSTLFSPCLTAECG